jgi:arylsulfatase A-like enzyme
MTSSNRFLVVTAACITCWTWLFQLAAAADKPNVLIVMTDDQGLGDFSITGNPVLKTPTLDAFAKQSIRLTDFHVCPMCSPTRGQLLTGLAALRNGATSVTAGRTFLRPGIPTIADAFGGAGYATGIFGKWHLGDFYPHRPIDKGFQKSISAGDSCTRRPNSIGR